jgi:cytochrome c-type biogenesis protein CcmH/NrfG
MARICKQIIVLLLAAVVAACGNTSMVKKNELLQLQADAANAYEKEDWRTAERRFKALTERVPGEGEFWFRLGNIYARTHRPEEAVKAYKEALIRQKVKSKTWHNMGIVYVRQAANAFTQMLEDMPADDPLFGRAMDLNEAILKILHNVDMHAEPIETPQ